MMTKLLPERESKYSDSSLPAAWQTVILRNYGMVSAETLAKVLKTDVPTVHAEAGRLGLKRAGHDPVWLTHGYITLIRQNWHLLSYGQLLDLLSINADELAFILKEDDFLDVKLGNFKPKVMEPVYTPLTAVQLKDTEKAAAIIRQYDREHIKKPFDFAADFFEVTAEKENANAKPLVEERFLYNYNAVYGDPFLEGAPDSYDDKLLAALSALGVNGLWTQGLLYKLSEFPFDPVLSGRCKERLTNIHALTQKLKKYGMKLYLYFNEPRSMPLAFFDKYPELKGVEENGYAALCTSVPAVKDYLYRAVKSVAESLPDLGGIFTITMSENLTNCYSHAFSLTSKTKNTCPRCRIRKASEIIAEVNNIFQKALNDAKSGAVLITHTWEIPGRETIDETVGLLDQKIKVLAVSEDRMPLEIGGVQSEVIDYSISHPGPSPKTAATFQRAAQTGHKTVAKVQINNSWECSAVPYLPVFPLIHKQLSALAGLSVSGLFLGWTLGGFPSPNLMLTREFYYNKKVDLSAWYKKVFGKDAAQVESACQKLSDGFSHFPFSLDFLYNGPQNYGPAVFMFSKRTEQKATMIGFPYDDVDSWKGPLSGQQLAIALKTMSDLWNDGLRQLEAVQTPEKNTAALLPFVRAAGIHFSSAYIQTAFALLKKEAANKTLPPEYNEKSANPINAVLTDTVSRLTDQRHDLIETERKNTADLITLLTAHPSIGYEASNHYYYTKNLLLEKLVNLSKL
ncbi:hypothetical protein FACS1894211_07690 [Clostridia bacterium]|nr:hypothetical protein FACS1894211_07690 [Clostridia bacterium]